MKSFSNLAKKKKMFFRALLNQKNVGMKGEKKNELEPALMTSTALHGFPIHRFLTIVLRRIRNCSLSLS